MRASDVFGFLLAAAVHVGAAAAGDATPRRGVTNELLPFVQLKGVHLEILGLVPVLGSSDESELRDRGLSRRDEARLRAAIRADVAAQFRGRSPALLTGEPPRNSHAAPPILEVRIDTWAARDGGYNFRCGLRLLERAVLARDSAEAAWAETWDTGLFATASGDELFDRLREGVGSLVRQFLQEYRRAHAPPR
jgi:hypothetical protein